MKHYKQKYIFGSKYRSQQQQQKKPLIPVLNVFVPQLTRAWYIPPLILTDYT